VITVDFSRLRLAAGARILDVGCGTGRHACAAYALEAAWVVGTDLSHRELLEARGRLRYHDALGAHGGGDWSLCRADIHNLPFGDDCFDLVICSEVLEHVNDDRRAVAELVRVLKPGAPLVVSVPRCFPERICWALSSQYGACEGGHIRIYRKRKLVGLVAAAGTRPTHSHHAHSLHVPYWWLKCIVGPHRNDLPAVAAYHRLLTFMIMKKPSWLIWLERLLNPVLGKSLVLYFTKPGEPRA